MPNDQTTGCLVIQLSDGVLLDSLLSICLRRKRAIYNRYIDIVQLRDNSH